MAAIMYTDNHTMTQVQPVSTAVKRPRKSDYEEMRELTEGYLRKVRKTLETCTHAGVLQSSLQRYFNSEQFVRNHTDGVSRASVLAFIMHAAEVAQRPPPAQEPPAAPKPVAVEESKRSEVGSQTVREEYEAASQTVEVEIEAVPEPPKEPVQEELRENPKEVVVKESAKEPPKEVFKELAREPVREAVKEVVPAEKPTTSTAELAQKSKNIFTTSIGRKESSKEAHKAPRSKTLKNTQATTGKIGRTVVTPAAPPMALQMPPPQQYYPSLPDYICESCRERFRTEADLQNHNLAKHMQAEPSGLETNAFDGPNVFCPIDGCGEQFEDYYELLLHMRSSHS